LWGWKKVLWVELLFCCLVRISVYSQEPSLKDMLARYLLRNSLNIGSVPEKIRFADELIYSLTANGFIVVNWLHDNKVNQVNIFQNLKYQYYLQNDRTFRLSGTFIHNLGFQHYFDSITKINVDDNTVTTRLDIKIDGRFAFTINSNISTRLMNGFDYVNTDSGLQIKVLNSSFLTPLIWTLSSGIGYTWKNFGFVNLGLSACKLTSILNKQIFSIREITSYYGIEQGKTHLLEYGFAFQLLIDKDIFRTLHWDCDLLLFKNYNSSVDLAFKNLFGLRINKFIKFTLQTRIFYEEKLCKHLQFENLLAIGLYLRL
jgi:hypothetical protein